ncbi:MAG: hypothetical protein ACE5Q6_08340 [Dehalococcoidia bacterium]
MLDHASKNREDKARTEGNKSTQKDGHGNAKMQFLDNRPESAQLRNPQEMAINSPQAMETSRLQAMLDNSPEMVAQRQQIARMSGVVVPQEGALQVVQRTGGLSSTLEGGDAGTTRTAEQPIQRVLNGNAAPGGQAWRYGLVHGTYDTNTNSTDAHIDVGGPGASLTRADMLAAVQDIYQAMQARQAAGGPAGWVDLNPQGAVALKTVVELLGASLGSWWGKVQAMTLKFAREKTQTVTKSKLAGELDPVIIPEHMAFLRAIVAVGGVSIKPIIPGTMTLAEFDQNILDNTAAGRARMAQYKAALEADTAVSMRVRVDQNVLPNVITTLRG